MNDLHHKPTNDPAKAARKETRKKDLKVYLKFLLIYLCAAPVGLLLCFTGSEGLMMLGEMVILIPGIFLLLLLPAILLSPQKRNTTEKNPQKNDTPKAEVLSAHKMNLKEDVFYYIHPKKHCYPIWMKGKTVYTDPNCDTAGGNVPYLRIKEYPISEELIHDGGISREDLLEFLQSIGESIPSEIIPEWIPIE